MLCCPCVFFLLFSSASVCVFLGKRVSVNTRRFWGQCFPDATTVSYVQITVDGTLAGHAFACRWNCNGMKVCQVTQLSSCGKGPQVATGLLRALRKDTDDVHGIVGSHPAACLAATRASGTTIERASSLDFIGKNAGSIMEITPIPYIRDSRLRGTLFDNKDSTALISGMDTKFFVEHDEPLEALTKVREL
ncbi:hypothetical protein EV127DRAFT_495468 [Xylaria flabelliformis]|nr:hypothetical protein EV127DRAFT_495468 [Xylaria flabelliformis]